MIAAGAGPATRDRARISAEDDVQRPGSRSRSSGSTASSTGPPAPTWTRSAFPFATPSRADREVVALLASCMAYGRVDLFGPWVDWALARMGESPARFVLGFDPAKHAARFEGFRYRFNRPRDLAAFCLATQRVLIRHGSLGAASAPASRPATPTWARPWSASSTPS